MREFWSRYLSTAETDVSTRRAKVNRKWSTVHQTIFYELKRCSQRARPDNCSGFGAVPHRRPYPQLDLERISKHLQATAFSRPRFGESFILTGYVCTRHRPWRSEPGQRAPRSLVLATWTSEQKEPCTYHHTQQPLDNTEIPSVNTEWDLQPKTLASQAPSSEHLMNLPAAQFPISSTDGWGRSQVYA